MSRHPRQWICSEPWQTKTEWPHADCWGQCWQSSVHRTAKSRHPSQRIFSEPWQTTTEYPRVDCRGSADREIKLAMSSECPPGSQPQLQALCYCLFLPLQYMVCEWDTSSGKSLALGTHVPKAGWRKHPKEKAKKQKKFPRFLGQKEHPRALCPLLCFTVGRVDTSQFHSKDEGGGCCFGTMVLDVPCQGTWPHILGHKGGWIISWVTVP